MRVYVPRNRFFFPRLLVEEGVKATLMIPAILVLVWLYGVSLLWLLG